MSLSKFISRLNSHVRLAISVGASLLVFIYLYGTGSPSVHWMITWLAFCVCHLSFSWITILTCDPTDKPDLAKKQDAGRTLTFIFILVATLVSLLAVVLLLGVTKNLKGADLIMHISLSIASVVCSWSLLHTNFIFKYAHLYYISDNEIEPTSKTPKGLDFPGDREPQYWDFTYYSFVIGTTFQVSDVAICTTRIRKVVLLHSLLSFGFNATIIALTINIISGLVK